MRLLLFGGWGQLGTDISLAAQRRGDELVRPTHGEADVTDDAAVRRVVDAARPDVVVNAAAFHKVELCDEDPSRAFAVNALGAINVARAARAARARSVYISTDYVFDGTSELGYSEEEAPSPLNVYGVSKVAGELAARQADPSALVIRGSGLFGHAGSSGKGGNFVDNMIARARAGEPLAVVDDQVFSPTATHDMAARILALVERDPPPGIYHAANSGACSWYQLARRAFEIERIDADLRARVTEEQVVRRPAHSMLLDTKGPALGLPQARSWDEALRWYLENRPTPVGASST